MSLTQGAALPDVTVKQTAATTAPDYYTNYLSNLATTGQAQVTGAVADPSKMVAGFGELQNAVLQAAPLRCRDREWKLQCCSCHVRHARVCPRPS
jgi:hypothetical protein